MVVPNILIRMNAHAEALEIIARYESSPEVIGRKLAESSIARIKKADAEYEEDERKKRKELE